MANSMRRGSEINQSFENFYNAFVSCPETHQAIENGIISTSKKGYKRPLSVRKKELSSLELTRPLVSAIPSPYSELLRQQLDDGRWGNLEDVLSCLHVPYGRYLGIETMEIWEEATIFALAMIRQRYDLFPLLGDAHDRAMKWILSSKHLLKQAIEIIVKYQDPSIERKPKSPQTSLTKKKLTFDVPIDPYKKLLDQASRLNYSRSYSNVQSTNNEKDSEEILAAQVEEERKKLALSLMNPTVNYSLVMSELTAAHAQFQACEV